MDAKLLQASLKRESRISSVEHAERDIASIYAAINAHGRWKFRIKDAIRTGESNWNPEELKPDNQCAFGKWLYSFPLDERDEHFKVVHDLHAKFHQAAAKVLELAITGRQEEAHKLSHDFNSEYSILTSELVLALSNWSKELQTTYGIR